MITFAKAHAYGNDFLYTKADAIGGTRPDLLAREMCDRHTGIGADGLILYSEQEDDVSMRLFNADGSRAEVSGNGVRALGALVLLQRDRAQLGRGGRPSIRASLTVHTEAGPKPLTRTALEGTRQTFRAAMGLPRDVRRVPIAAAGESLNAVILNFGNPQCIVLGPLPGEERFRRLGAALERHRLFPEGTNVEFAEVDASGRVRIVIWERGCGPTQSSGTGSCASLVAAAIYGGAPRDTDVIAPGGTQRVEWREDNVYLTGWAEVVCEGEWLRPLPA